MSIRRSIPRRVVGWFAAAATLVAFATVPPAGAGTASTVPATSTVLDWNLYAVNALTATGFVAPCAAQFPTVASIHMAMVQGAVYDAVNAIDGRHQPYLSGLPAVSPSASLDAAAATAAHHVLIGLAPVAPVPSFCPAILAQLDGAYDELLGSIADGPAKTGGIAIGAAAAAAMLAAREDDGRFGAPGFTVADPLLAGDWRPIPVNDPFAWVRDVRPFLLENASQVRTRGPNALTSKRYTKEFNEVKAIGSASSTTRTADQTALAFFYTENGVPLWNRTFRTIAEDQGLSLQQEARLFAMLNMAGADSFIGCWDDKEYWSFWRPITAIQLADTDGNPATDADPTWTPLVATPPYPDHPSGYNCYTAGFMYTAKQFFGKPVTFTVHSNAVGAGPDRTYARFTDVLPDTIDARVYLGIHFRTPDEQGAGLGRDVAQWLKGRFFQRV